jgi:hypothetical protein
MQLISMDKLEDCFDGSVVFQLTVSPSWTSSMIAALAQLGPLDYYAGFPRPFFRVRGPEGFEIRGVEGEDRCRLILPRRDRDAVQTRVLKVLTKIPSKPASVCRNDI